MGAPDIGDPIAHRLVDGFLEGPLAGLDGAHLRSHEPHPEHVERLPFHVDRTHVDDALKPEFGAHGGRGHAVLPRARLGDDSLLPHPTRKERLADRIVDLVGTRVQQVLALEVDLRAAAVPRQALREIQGGRPPGKLGQMVP
jgi:hypothetical protein